MTRPLEGKVALVTGAGQGIGRAAALELARHGARVVVNDLGVGLHGDPSASGAVTVAEEIREAGGEAVVNMGDVADFEQARAMIEQGVHTWGRFDILVNNAGILRDRMLFNMSEQEWDDVIRVHLRGHFCTLRWATAYWRDLAKAEGTVYGHVVNTASEAFLSGSARQPNYAAAKAGIVQLTLSTAQAMARYGVTANAICPRALTRMTSEIEGFDADDHGLARYAPENVSPLIAYLASPASASVSGQVFLVYGREITVLAGPSVDRQFHVPGRWTVESVDHALSPFYAERVPVAQGFGLRVPAEA